MPWAFSTRTLTRACRSQGARAYDGPQTLCRRLYPDVPCPTHRQRRRPGTIRSISAGKTAGAWVDSLPNITITALFWKPYSGSRASSLWAQPAGRRSSASRTPFTRFPPLVWCQDGVFNDDRFARLTADLEPDLDTVMVEGAFVKARRHGAGAPKAMPSQRRMKAGPRRPLASVVGTWPDLQAGKRRAAMPLGVYGVRHFVENRFAVVKGFRGIVTRYCQ